MDWKYTRHCRFENVCFDRSTSRFIFARYPSSILVDVPEDDGGREFLVGDTTVTGAHYFSLKDVLVNPHQPSFDRNARPWRDDEFYHNRKIQYRKGKHFLFFRWEHHNPMHNLHDDVLPMYFTIKENTFETCRVDDEMMRKSTNQTVVESSKGQLRRRARLGSKIEEVSDAVESSGGLCSLDHWIVIDEVRDPPQSSGDQEKLYSLLSKQPLLYVKNFDKPEHEADLTCFSELIVGPRKTTTWYQWGLGQPQGPLMQWGREAVNGYWIREATDWLFAQSLLQQNSTSPTPSSTPSTTDLEEAVQPDLILVFSRTRNRIILNENDLLSTLSTSFPDLKAQFLRMENTSLFDLWKIIRRARVIVSMHGAMLAFAMFAPRGSVVVEMFPYAMGSKNFQCYRTMAELRGMGLVYRAWDNPYEDKTITHPDREPYFGGIQHLSEEEQDSIRRARWVPDDQTYAGSSYWAYRLYQDTVVTIPEVVDVVRDGLEESRTRFG
ncbi:Protein O-linked-mannose beta-1,4-N-acetylglucosaminyltransferase 2 [Quaeritorhiza haematococci]|nr:Protein O-linked-mannose beta-1,4-N-acetylglucosaminyltransferase 2 [Quaeritorhiza haematococci]